MTTDPLRAREIFHLEFLRGFARSATPESYVLKGGCNMRFFFGSVRYSEDMDLDAAGIPVHQLQDRVMGVLGSPALATSLRTFGITRLALPSMARAKQTETVQRFKVHLTTAAGEDLATKIEFSRRGFDAPVARETVAPAVLAAYRVPPLIVPHYAAAAAFQQKLRALVGRRQPMARDVFDLFVLSARPEIAGAPAATSLSRRDLDEARARIFAIEFAQFRDTVVNFLAAEDRRSYASREAWDEMRLTVVTLIERLEGDGAR